MKIFKRKKKGFTLVELVIVIAVIAVLSAVLIPVFGNVINNAKVSKAKANVRIINEKIVMRALNDGRSSYSADEIKQILEDYDFDRASSPDGYSLWYDASVNNLRLLENETAFSTASRTVSAGGTTANSGKIGNNTATFAKSYAIDGVTAGNNVATYDADPVEVGNRCVEAINPYNRDLYYVDQTITEIDRAINEIKGSTGSGIVATAEAAGGTSADISARIVDAYKTKLNNIASALSGKDVTINTNDLVSAMAVDKTLYIGNNGMYLPAFDSSDSATPSVSCVNSLVDGGVIEIKSQKLNENLSLIHI